MGKEPKGAGVAEPPADAAEAITSAHNTPKRTLLFHIALIQTECTAVLLAALSTCGGSRRARSGGGSSPG